MLANPRAPVYTAVIPNNRISETKLRLLKHSSTAMSPLVLALPPRQEPATRRADVFTNLETSWTLALITVNPFRIDDRSCYPFHVSLEILAQNHTSIYTGLATILRRTRLFFLALDNTLPHPTKPELKSLRPLLRCCRTSVIDRPRIGGC